MHPCFSPCKLFYDMTDEGQTVVPLFGAQMRFRLTFSIAAAAAHVELFVVEERASKACARGRGRWHACRRCRKRNLTWGRRASDVKVAPRNMARVVGVGVGRYLNNYRWEIGAEVPVNLIVFRDLIMSRADSLNLSLQFQALLMT